MANYFYTDGNGQKQGTITGLLALALAMLSLGAVGGCGNSNDSVLTNTALASSGGGDSALVGRWVLETEKHEDGSAVHQNFRVYSPYVDMLKDGIVACYNEVGVGDGGTWKTEGGRLYMIGGSGSRGYDYKILGTTLTFTAGGGRTATYKKQ